MATGFYEMLGVHPGASEDQIRTAYQQRLAELVRRLRDAREKHADTSILEMQERELKEAAEVLTHEPRRRSYDAYRQANQAGMPNDAAELWSVAKDALADPVAAAAMQTVSTLTNLPIGDVGRMPQPESTGPMPQGQVVVPPSPELTGPRYTGPGLGVGGAGLTGPAEPSVSPAHEVTSATDPVIGDDPVATMAMRYGHDGRFLRAVRESRGLSLDELAAATRISRRYLEAIEENGFDKLPAVTFVRGYVKEIATVLEVAGSGVVEGYLALYVNHRG